MDDRDVVGRIRSGDVDAFAMLYRTHVGAVARVVRDNVHDPESVADIVQEVFTRALENLASLRDGDRFRPWLLSIARHTAVDNRRLRCRVEMRPWDEASLQRATTSAAGPDDAAELRELARLVAGCVSGLSVRDATAISLVTHFDFRPSEVAAALGVSEGAAKVIVHRARNRLRVALTLELMVRRKGSGCETIGQLLDAGDVVAAGRHVRDCGICADLVRSEVSLHHSDAPPPGKPVIDLTSLDQRAGVKP